MKLPTQRGGNNFRRVGPALVLVSLLTAAGVLVTNQPNRVAEAASPTLTLPTLFPVPTSGTSAPTNGGTPTSGNTPTAGRPTTGSSPTSTPGMPPPLSVAPPPTGANPGPGRIWTLTSSKLILSGSQFHGYAQQDVCGKPVTTLHFTVSKLQITDLVQRGDLGKGNMVTAAGAPGSVSTVTQGPTEMYTMSLSGTLNILGFPVVPITLSPNGIFPPNIDLSFLKLPDLTFTNVTARNVDLNGGILAIPGSHISVSPGGMGGCPG